MAEATGADCSRRSGPIATAKCYHQQYLDALNAWDNYRSNVGESEHSGAYKIALWDRIKNVVIECAGDSSLPEPQTIYENLGSNEDESVYSIVSDRRDDWSATDPVQKTLLLDEEPISVGGGWPLDDLDVEDEFISVGRKVVGLREMVERRAKRLVDFVNHGELKGIADTFYNDGAEKGLTEEGSADSFEDARAGVPLENEFYAALFGQTYPEQVSVIKELTYRLNESTYGKRFLHDLFENGEDAIFSPYDLVDPPLSTNLTEDQWTKRPISFATVDEQWRYFDEADGQSGSGTPERGLAKFVDASGEAADSTNASLAHELLVACYQLLPGLALYYRSNQSSSQAQSRTAEFFGHAFGLWFTDDMINQRLSANFSQNDPERPDWGTTIETLQNGTWSAPDTYKLSTTFVGKSDAIFNEGFRNLAYRKLDLDTATIDDIENIPAQKFVGGLKLFISGYGSFEAVWNYDGTPESAAEGLEQTASLLQIASDAPEISVFIGDLEAIRDASTGTRRLAADALVRLEKLSPILDTMGAVTNALKAHDEWDSNDYNSALGYGALSASSGLFAVAGFGGSAGAGVLSTGVVGVLVLAGIALLATGMALITYMGHGPLTDWVKYTKFGVLWDTVIDDEEYKDPSNDHYGYAYPTMETIQSGPDEGNILFSAREPNYVRQLSRLATLARPIGVTKAEVGNNWDWTGNWGAELALDPSHGRLTTDGVVFVRPIDPTDEDPITVGSDDRWPAPPVHRIRLGDENTDDVTYLDNCAVPIDDSDLTSSLTFKPDPMLLSSSNALQDIVNEYANDSSLATMKGVDLPVHKWDATIDTQSSDDVPYLCGFDEDRLNAHHKAYLEFVYVPSEAADLVDANGANLRDIPMLTRERVELDKPGEVHR